MGEGLQGFRANLTGRIDDLQEPPLPAMIKQPRILSLMPTRQCNASCTHCGTFSGPKTKVRLDPETIRQAINEAAEQHFDVVVFTGGEATLAGPALLDYIALATRRGLCTRLVTNGHWARDDRRTHQFVKRLAEAGLQEINFSTGDQHARFIPVERVLAGAIASVEIGMTTAIMIELVADRLVTKASLLSHPMLSESRGRKAVSAIMFNESPWMSTDPTQAHTYPDGILATDENVHQFKGCDSILSTVTIEADGRVYACCGLGMTKIPELALGMANEASLAQMIDRAEDDFLKRWIRTEGPERILSWAAGRDPEIEWSGRHAHKCQACMQLYTDPKVRHQIRTGFEDVLPEIVALEWMLHYMPEMGDVPADVLGSPIKASRATRDSPASKVKAT